MALPLGYLNLPFILGLFCGTAYAVLNFFILGRTVEIALDRPPAKAQRYMAGQYFVRMGLTAVVIIIAIKVDFINVLGVILPLLYPRLALSIHHIFRKEAKNR